MTKATLARGDLVIAGSLQPSGLSKSKPSLGQTQRAEHVWHLWGVKIYISYPMLIIFLTTRIITNQVAIKSKVTT